MVDFEPGLSGPLRLTSSTLAITNGMTIDGPGAGTIEIDGDGLQILTVSGPGAVSISGLTFAFGAATPDGGAIANSGTLTVRDARFEHNAAGGDGAPS